MRDEDVARYPFERPQQSEIANAPRTQPENESSLHFRSAAAFAPRRWGGVGAGVPVRGLVCRCQTDVAKQVGSPRSDKIGMLPKTLLFLLFRRVFFTRTECRFARKRFILRF